MTQEEQIAAAMEAFFAKHNVTEKEQEAYTEMMINGYTIIDSEGNIRKDIDLSKILIIGDTSIGITMPLTTQKSAQVNREAWDNLPKKEEPKQKVKIEIPQIQEIRFCNTIHTKKRYNRRGKGSKYF